MPNPTLRRRNLLTACILVAVSLAFAASVFYVRAGRGPLLPPSNPAWQPMVQTEPQPALQPVSPTNQPEAPAHGQAQ